VFTPGFHEMRDDESHASVAGFLAVGPVALAHAPEGANEKRGETRRAGAGEK
jgi:hypothetical protein